MDIQQIKEQLISDPEVRAMIGRRAFEIFHSHMGRGGDSFNDWLQAENEILPRLIEQILEKNRQSLETADEADPTRRMAAEHMQEVIAQEEPASAAATAEAKKPARKTAVRKAAPAGTAEKKPAAKKTAAKKAPAEGEAEKKPAARKTSAKKAPAEGEAEKKPAAKRASTRKKKE